MCYTRFQAPQFYYILTASIAFPAKECYVFQCFISYLGLHVIRMSTSHAMILIVIGVAELSIVVSLQHTCIGKWRCWYLLNRDIPERAFWEHAEACVQQL